MNLDLSDPVGLGKQLREIRERRRLTQGQVELIIHMPQTTLSNYEQGKVTPRTRELILLLDCYGYTPVTTLKAKALRYVPALPPPGQSSRQKPKRAKAKKARTDDPTP